MSQPPLLDLNTLIERPKIKIDGKDYEIFSPDELSVLDSQRFTIWGTQLEKLGADKSKADELEILIEKAARAAFVDIPDDVFAKLSGMQKLSVVEVFTMLLLRKKMGVAGAFLAESQQTGVK